MEIKQLHKDQFEIIVYLEDLKKFNIDFFELMSKGIQNSNLFSIILDNIDKISDSSLRNKKFVFETFFCNDAYFLIEFHIIGILSEQGNFLCKTGTHLSISEIVPMIFSFSSFNSLCDFFNYLSNFGKEKLSFLLEFTEFYKYQENYFVIIKDSIFYTNFFDFVSLHISEFANFVSFSDILVKKIEEYGCMINM